LLHAGISCSCLHAACPHCNSILHEHQNKNENINENENKKKVNAQMKMNMEMFTDMDTVTYMKAYFLPFS
jgi:hypothetical protein